MSPPKETDLLTSACSQDPALPGVNHSWAGAGQGSWGHCSRMGTPSRVTIGNTEQQSSFPSVTIPRISACISGSKMGVYEMLDCLPDCRDCASDNLGHRDLLWPQSSARSWGAFWMLPHGGKSLQDKDSFKSCYSHCTGQTPREPEHTPPYHISCQ